MTMTKRAICLTSLLILLAAGVFAQAPSGTCSQPNIGLPITTVYNNGSQDLLFGCVTLPGQATPTWQPLPFAETTQSVTVALTAAQVAAMNATPVQIIPAQGPGTLIDVGSVVVDYIYKTAAYTSGGAIQLSYGTGTTNAASATIAATFLTSPSANTAIRVAGALASTSTSALLNTAVNITNATAAFATGSGSLVVKVSYRVLTGLL